MNRISVIALVSALAACSQRAATQEDYEDTAQAIGTMALLGGGGGDVASLRDAVAIAHSELPFGFGRRDAEGKIGGDRFGVEYSYTTVCKDAAGAELARCDRTTDQAEIDVSWQGRIELPHLAAEVKRDGSWTLTGLQSETASLSGDSSFSLDTTATSIFRDGVTATLEIDAAAEYDAIQIATATRELVGGSASFALTVHKTVTGTGTGGGSDDDDGDDDDRGDGPGKLEDVDRTFTVDATITFNPDRTADLVIDGTEFFEIDLETGRITRVPAP